MKHSCFFIIETQKGMIINTLANKQHLTKYK